MFANLISVLYFRCFHYRLCCIINSDIDISRSHPSHKWHRTKTTPAIKWPNFTVFRATSCRWEPMYRVDSKSYEFVVKVSGSIKFSSCIIKIVCLHHMLRRYTFTFHWLCRVQLVTNLRSYSSKSEYYDVFRQDKCPSLDFKTIFICLCLRSFDPRETLINCFASSTFHWIIQRSRKRWW